MLKAVENQALASWCRTRCIGWTETEDPDGDSIILLVTMLASQMLRPIVLLHNAQGFQLLDERGETLATASDLPAVLDALDAGVAERPAIGLHEPSSLLRRPAPVAAH